MADVFVSYSRSDAEFVSWLADDLKGRGKDVWIDVDGIRDAERFPEALRRAIEGSDAFVFVISPASVDSEFCEQEVAHASALNKRIVPLSLRPVPDHLIPPEIRFLNWIPVSDGTPVIDRVIAAIETDLDWEHQHTRITLRAIQWDDAGRDHGALLRGSELADAERWLGAGAGKEPGPTTLEQEYLLAARQAAVRRQRTLTAAVSGMLVVALALLVFALISRQNAIKAESNANAQRLAVLSESQLSVDPERAVLLAMAAVRKDATYGPTGTMFALRAALDASMIRYRLAPAGQQSCGTDNPQFDPAPGSNIVAEGLCDGKLRFFNATTGELERVVTVGSRDNPATQLAYPPSRTPVLAGAVGDRLVVLNPVTAALERRGPVVPALGGDVFDPSAPLMAVVGRLGRLVIWNYETGRAKTQQPHLPLANLTDLALGPPGLLAFSFSGGEPASSGIVIYDYVTRRIVAKLQLQDAYALAYAPDGKQLAVGFQSAAGTGTVELLNGRTLAVDPSFHPIRDPFENVGDVAWSLDGRYLAYGFEDGSAGVVDGATGRLVQSYSASTSTVLGLAISPDDRLLLTSSQDGTAEAFTTRSRGLLRTIRAGSIAQLAITRGGFVVIANPGPGRGEGVVVERFSNQGREQSPPLVLSRGVNAIAASLSPSGTVAAAGPGGPAVQSAPLHVWSVGARRVLSTITFPNGTGADPVIGPRGDVIAQGVIPIGGYHPGNPAKFELINLRTGDRRVIAADSAACNWADWAFSPSGASVTTATWCGQVSVWSVATGHRLGGSIQIPGSVNSFAFSPDGRRLALASSNGTVFVSSVPLTGRLSSLNASTKSAQAVAWSPDGRYLATAGLDLIARIYDARTLTELRTIPLPDPPQGLAFTANSQDLLTWDAGVTVREWDACTDCESPSALLALARTRVTRSLTQAERREFGVS